MSSAKFELQRTKSAQVTDIELIDDLKRVAKEINSNIVSSTIYNKLGKYDVRTIGRRFGTWNLALEKANLEVNNSNQEKSDNELFENIMTIWQYLGKQPPRSSLSQYPSVISQNPYNRRFGSWTKALECFVEYANNADIKPNNQQPNNFERKQAGRDPSVRLRFKVLQRDKFTCCACGASPAKSQNVELHIDHILPWSKGGETVFENLQTLCSKCNLDKSNVLN